MNLQEEARRVLEKAGYRVFSSDAATLHFEDDTVMGFVNVCQSGEQILASWRELQSSFLRKNSDALRASGLKSWNIYSVFLSSSNTSSQTKRELLTVEEDFQSTRKIAQSELLSPADVVRALLPLIPVQNLVELRQDDPLARLRDRVGDKVMTALERIDSTDELSSIFLNLTK